MNVKRFFLILTLTLLFIAGFFIRYLTFSKKRFQVSFASSKEPSNESSKVLGLSDVLPSEPNLNLRQKGVFEETAISVPNESRTEDKKSSKEEATSSEKDTPSESTSKNTSVADLPFSKKEEEIPHEIQGVLNDLTTFATQVSSEKESTEESSISTTDIFSWSLVALFGDEAFQNIFRGVSSVTLDEIKEKSNEEYLAYVTLNFPTGLEKYKVYLFKFDYGWRIYKTEPVK